MARDPGGFEGARGGGGAFIVMPIKLRAARQSKSCSDAPPLSSGRGQTIEESS